MARITVEDCLGKVPNRFSLVLAAAERTKQLIKGADKFVQDTDNKEVVTALREVAAGHISVDDSAVQPDESWMPAHHSKQTAAPAVDDELPPEV